MRWLARSQPVSLAAGKEDQKQGFKVSGLQSMIVRSKKDGLCARLFVRTRHTNSTTDYRRNVPETIMFVSVSIAIISLSAFTATRVRSMGRHPLGRKLRGARAVRVNLIGSAHGKAVLDRAVEATRGCGSQRTASISD
jgi:hypothetical protein